MVLHKFHFLALGLIGGSIAKAIRKARPDAVINAYARHPEKLNAAVMDGTVNRVTAVLDDIDPDTDIIFLCAPTGANISNLKELAADKKLADVLGNIIITDVGSVKGDIQNCAESLGITANFLGGHPMTGREKSGYENSDASLLENTYYLLAPSADTKSDYTEALTALVKELHSIPLVTSPSEHDRATAAISHVPHLIAAALVKSVKDHDNREELMRTIAAGGFRDITRIASSDPSMWENICRSNTEEIRAFLRSYINELEKIDDYLEKKEFSNISGLFKESGAYRSSMPVRGRGSMQGIWRIFVDIPDESGAIAGIAALLALKKISIKNTGITHNREQAEGALYIEFYDERSLNDSLPLIKAAGYNVIVDK